jgi:acyl-CoA reductase-like NAD-dependent aldehyde dehydrogenase
MSETKKTAKTAKASKAAKTSLLEDVAAEVTAPAAAPAAPRSSVRKTYKLYIGGAFPRSESGRSYAVTASTGEFIANAAQASRKDARDAVRAARAAQPGWAKATAYNRGQILYRIAEMLEERRDQFAQQIAGVEGVAPAAAYAQVDAAVDRWVWYAGWSDKLAQVLGAANPVAGPYWNISSPEPTGVVALLAPATPTLLGLTSVIAPAIVGGNAVVAVAPDASAVPAVTLGEVMATSDLPGGVVNILTGDTAELAPWLASHLDVNALDLAGVPAGSDLARDLEVAAAENLKRVVRPAAGQDWSADPGLSRVKPFLETKTVWHPIGI